MIIDIFNEVYTRLRTVITEATVLSEYSDITPVFPCIVIQELSNNTDVDTIDSSGETHNVLAFDVNIFSNADNKRTVCRELRNKVDSIMADEYGMERSDTGAVPNYNDLSIYRYNLRYSCIVDKNKKLYRG